jgi:hypothetical protein
MEPKKFTQSGTFSVLVLGPLFLLTLILALILKPSDIMGKAILGFVSLTMGICLLIFYKLTIIIDDTHLSFKLGAGLVSRKYPLASIKECSAVRNNPFTGIGIRLYSKGWLFNVSGLGAIELTFKNKSSRIRIGTDKPEEIAQFVSGRLGKEFEAIAPEKDFIEKSGYWMVAIVLVSLFLPVILVVSGRRETKTVLNETDINIKGMYGISISYKDLIKLDTMSRLPGIKRRTNGYALGGTLKGNFRLDDKTDVKLFVVSDSPPFIFIETNEYKIYLNYPDPGRTRELFRMIEQNSK